MSNNSDSDISDIPFKKKTKQATMLSFFVKPSAPASTDSTVSGSSKTKSSANSIDDSASASDNVVMSELRGDRDSCASVAVGEREQSFDQPKQMKLTFLSVPRERLARDDYIRSGPIREVMDTFPKTVLFGKRRSFQRVWFEGRSWLEYSKHHDAAFCFPCRIFGNTEYDATFQESGFRQWHHALLSNKGFDKHSKSKEHLDNMKAWQDFSRSSPIDLKIDAERKRIFEHDCEERQKRYEVLPILCDVTNTLARLRLPFRGHDETVHSSNKGIFVEVVELVARWNEDLAEHLKQAQAAPKSYPSYTSPVSQNEMIDCSAEVVRNSLVINVKEAKFYAVCLDTTPDSSKEDQLSVILRYVSKNGDINEELLDIVHAGDMTAGGVFNTLLSTLERYELRMDNIRGQGYDGCSTMSGQYTGVQARVREVSNCAYFVHCFAHRLNLVIVDTCSKNRFVRNFFGVVESLYVFIEGSTKRHAKFKAVRDQILLDCRSEESISCASSMSSEARCSDGGSKTLHSLSTTRWSSRVDNCKALADNLIGVTKTLTDITEDGSFDRKTAGESMSLLKCLDFEFCLLLTIMADLLSVSNIVSKSLQSSTVNIAAAALQVEALISEISVKRTDEQFEEFWVKATTMADSINVQFIEPRQHKVSKRIDQLWQTETSLSHKDELRVNLYFDVIDLFVSALERRFGTEVLPLLRSTDCLIKPSITKLPKLEVLHTFYPRDLDADQILLEYRLFCHAMSAVSASSDSSVEVDQSSIQSIYSYMTISGMKELYPNIALAYQLIMTLPVSSCSCERSFSALKFVKNSLRTTMTQSRLSDLMVLAVHAERMHSADIQTVVDAFWNRVSRR